MIPREFLCELHYYLLIALFKRYDHAHCAANNLNLTQPHLHVANIMLTIRYVLASLLSAHVLSREFKFPTRVPDFITIVILFHIVYKIALPAPA